VALLLDPPVRDEVNGLRRSLSDPSLTRIPPHITLVPPVNVRRDDLPSALAVLRRAAARSHPLALTIGAVATFLPVNPVLYLQVGGDRDGLRELRDAVFVPPLERTLSWPWVPHVTLADGAEEERVAAGLRALAGYAVVAEIDRVVILEEGPGRRWEPLADALLGAPARIGTGGLPVELTRGRIVDPTLEAPPLPGTVQGEPLVVTAHREGAPVGWARAWFDREGTHREVFVVEPHRGQGIGGHLKAHLDWAVSVQPKATEA
jgi:2'-5' RNA ligase